jgi:hypothetical protein
MSLIDLTNYSEHPVEPGWLVFRYPTQEHARDMTDELQRAGIRWEADLVDGPPFMVGVRKVNRSAAEKLNYVVLGRYRKPFISSKLLRWVIIFVTVGILALAFAGMLMTGS